MGRPNLGALKICYLKDPHLNHRCQMDCKDPIDGMEPLSLELQFTCFFQERGSCEKFPNDLLLIFSTQKRLDADESKLWISPDRR